MSRRGHFFLVTLLIIPLAQRPLIFQPHGGHETVVQQRLWDGHLPVDLKCFQQLPPLQPVILQQMLLTGPVNGASVIPAQQPKCGSSSTGLGHSEQPPFSSHHSGVQYHPGGIAFAGQQLPSIEDVLLRCSKLIEQIYEQQQQQYPQVLFGTAALSKSAMAPPPSLSQPVLSFGVRASTWSDQALTSPTEVVGAHRERPLNARNHTVSGQGGRQEGMTFRITNEGRKRSRRVNPKRQVCAVEPLKEQVRLEPPVGRHTSIDNGKESGGQVPAAESIVEATGETKRPADEATRGVTNRSSKQVQVPEEPVEHPGSDMDSPSCGHVTDPRALTLKQTSGAAPNGSHLEQNDQCLALWVTDAVDHQLDRMKHPADVIPVEHPVRASAVVARVLNGNNFILSSYRYTPQQAKGVSSAGDFRQPFNNHRGRWLKPSGVEAFVNLPPPWPPPVNFASPTMRVLSGQAFSTRSQIQGQSKQEASSSSSTSTTVSDSPSMTEADLAVSESARSSVP